MILFDISIKHDKFSFLFYRNYSHFRITTKKKIFEVQKIKKRIYFEGSLGCALNVTNNLIWMFTPFLDTDLSI